MKSIRDLYNKILDYEGDDIFNNLIKIWIEENKYKSYLESVHLEILNYKEKKISIETSYELYALSRVLDAMTLKFQPIEDGREKFWSGPNISLDDYSAFIDLIGCSSLTPNDYHPFYCEISQAIKSDGDYKIENVLFPGIMLGNLMIKRAGMLMGFNNKEFNIDIINKSTLFWAHRRNSRPYEDLSVGWGSNSQWGTRFRFDILSDNSYIYNLYGDFDCSETNDKLSEELTIQKLTLTQATDLVRIRHLMDYYKNEGYLSPYYFKYIEKR